jgi:diphthamide synthase (EF-2-diphthine--ammonia ligase)
LGKKDTQALAPRLIELGFKAVITSVDSEVLVKDFVGREYDMGFLSDLPKDVDPCGEYGEFYSCVYDVSIFHERVCFTVGVKVLMENPFYYCDLIPM